VDEARNVYLVDCESAWDRSVAAVPDKLATVWMTPGFRRVYRGIPRALTYRDDWFAAGVLLFSMLLPVELLSVVLPRARERFLRAIVGAARLPGWIPQTIRALLAGRPRVARELLQQKSLVMTPRPLQPGRGVQGSFIADRIAHTVQGIADHIRGSHDVTRSDRLWPSDFKVFTTNPLSIAYGACGPLLFLAERGLEIPHELDKWLLARPLSVDKYTPGLYLGLSGIAYTFWRLGHHDRAVHTLQLACDSSLLHADSGMFFGAAGCGLVSLQMYLWTRDELFAATALKIGERIVQSATDTGRGIAWPDAMHGEVLPGFAHGASGIALFLLYLGTLVHEPRFVVAATRALDHELAAASVEFPDGLPRWKASPGRNTWSPYWLSGGCGVGSVLIRFYRALAEPRYLQLARDVARGNYSRFCVLPGQFEGASGIGEFMLDMSALSQEPEFEVKARDIAASILLYKVADNGATAFPGRFLIRLSTDYGYGSAGVGLFLDRFASRRRRLLHDLDGM
jgi:hypothetical protein